MATCFGWTWEYIDDFVTLPRLYEIWSAWESTPPLHQAFVGFMRAFGKTKGNAPGAGATTALEQGGDLLRDLGASGITALPALSPELKALLPVE